MTTTEIPADNGVNVAALLGVRDALADTPEIARKKKEIYVRRYNRPTGEAGFHFLTGKAESIARLTRAVGFRYEYDATIKQFAHPSGIVVLTPGGTVARYLFGSEFSPKDLGFSLAEASQGKVGSVATKLLMLCYAYDPKMQDMKLFEGLVQAASAYRVERA